jgi:hypothetical protein
MHLFERDWADNFRLKFEIELTARAWANACREIRTVDAPAQQIDGWRRILGTASSLRYPSSGL